MNEFEQDSNETQAAIDAGLASALPHPLDKKVAAYSVVVPRGAQAILVRTPPPDSDFTDAPLRTRAVYRPATVGTLIGLVERHGPVKPDKLTIWAHPTSGRFVAIFNDHSPTEPAWRDHRAELQLTVPLEWQHWAKLDNKLVDQVTFANHIEEGLTEIAVPDGAELLEIAQSIHGTVNATFRSGHRLSDGRTQFQYEENVSASAGAGKLTIPTQFELMISPFLGEDAKQVTALLRWRPNGGKVTLGYKLVHPEVVVRKSIEGIVEDLRERFPQSVFVGEPGV